MEGNDGGGVQTPKVRDNAEQLEVASLGSRRIRLTPDEAAVLVADFRRTRDGFRGRYAADVRDLPAPADRIATAILRASRATSEAAELRELAMDLIDLQAFVDLQSQAAPRPPARGKPPSPILEAVRWRQAAAIQVIREDPSVVGVKVAQGDRWTAIGDARLAMKRTSDYRETQAAGFIAIFAWLFAAPAGAIVARVLGLGEITLLTVLVLFAGWWLSPLLGSLLERFASVYEGTIRPRWMDASDGVAIAMFLVPLLALEFALGFLVAIATARIDL